MKYNILGFAILLCTFCFSQVKDDTIVLDKFTSWVNPVLDIIKDHDTETYSLNKVIYINNGLNKPVSVKLLWLFEKEYPNINLNAINSIILQGNNASKKYCKTPSSYVPTGFYITRSSTNEKNNWIFHSKFTGLTEYGIVGEYDKFFYFDIDGNLLKL